MKPHLYRVAGRWFCRLDHYGRLILAAGRRSPELAYEALREQLWPGWGLRFRLLACAIVTLRSPEFSGVRHEEPRHPDHQA